MALLRVMDLFCGTGGFSKGFENAGGFEVVFGIDILKTAVGTFRLNHPAAIGLAGDIRAVKKSDVLRQLGLRRGQIDVIIGGPPCQGFSSIRPFRSANEDDPRNTLFEEFASYVNTFRPTALVMENVVGLATHNGGETIEAIQQCFYDLGYDTDWRILNAAHFGVPQKRERLILIGVERGAPLSFPKPTHAGDFRTIGHKDSERMLRPAQPTLWNQAVQRLAPAVTVADAIDDLPPVAADGTEATAYTMPPRTAYQVDRRANAGAQLTLHSSTKHSERMLEIIRHSGSSISAIPSGLITSGFSSCYSRLDAEQPAVTITVNFVHPASNRCIHPTQDRALTPREGARLQSFDDDFTFAGTRTEIVKQIGNAVPPVLGRAIGASIAELVAGSQAA